MICLEKCIKLLCRDIPQVVSIVKEILLWLQNSIFIESQEWSKVKNLRVTAVPNYNDKWHTGRSNFFRLIAEKQVRASHSNFKAAFSFLCLNQSFQEWRPGFLYNLKFKEHHFEI